MGKAYNGNGQSGLVERIIYDASMIQPGGLLPGVLAVFKGINFERQRKMVLMKQEVWKLEIGNLKLEDGKRKTENGRCYPVPELLKLEITGTGDNFSRKPPESWFFQGSTEQQFMIDYPGKAFGRLFFHWLTKAKKIHPCLISVNLWQNKT